MWQEVNGEFHDIGLYRAIRDRIWSELDLKHEGVVDITDLELRFDKGEIIAEIRFIDTHSGEEWMTLANICYGDRLPRVKDDIGGEIRFRDIFIKEIRRNGLPYFRGVPVRVREND